MKFHDYVLLVIGLCLSLSLKANCPVPGYTLIDCLKYQIKNHKLPVDGSPFKPLSYCEFQKFYNHGNITIDQMNELIEYAYQEYNPILFKEADEIILPTEYSLNFLWIHKAKLMELGHLMGSNNEQLTRNVLDPIKDWQSKQPEAQINFWYDSVMVDAAAIEKTNEILATNNADLSKIKFRDIRDIDIVKQNEHLFVSEIPVYFRVDLAKAFIGDYVLRHDKLLFVINIDNDIVAVTRKHLFDKKTLNELKSIGYAFGSADAAEEENSFIILHNNQTLNLLDIHRELVIDKTIKEANTILTKSLPDSQNVFSKYKDFKTAMRAIFREKTGKIWKNQGYESLGKYMIFPASQFGHVSTYKNEEIILLKNALVTSEGCNK